MIALLWLACALPKPTTALATPSGELVPLEVLLEGRAVAVRACGACHAPPPPHRRSPEAWPEILDDMADRARLDAHERERLSAYVLALSIAPPETR